MTPWRRPWVSLPKFSMSRINQFEECCTANEPEGLTDYSGESVIEWLRGDKEITVSFPNATKECNRVLAYAKQYPDEVKITHQNADGSIVARIPKAYLRLTRPVRRELTEEQKAAAAERLRIAREQAAVNTHG